LRRFISETKNNLLKNKRPEKINYKLLKKRYMTTQKKVKKVVVKKTVWF